MNSAEPKLKPLDYHLSLRDYLRANERFLWDWFASAKSVTEHGDQIRLELLKSSYRLDRESHSEQYSSAEEVLDKLALHIPVTLYQSQNSIETNAALCYLPDEGHIVFSGPALNLLEPGELKSVMGHELAHHQLWSRDSGQFLVTDRMVQAAALDPRASSSHVQTARNLQLYTEVFADRGSLVATGDLEVVVSSLVKIQTGLKRVSVPGYLKQAEEVFSKSEVVTQGISHPELFIRARALKLWAEKGGEASEEIVRMIEGRRSLGSLDLMGQAQMARSTEKLLEQLLRPNWFQTPSVMAHARNYFQEFTAAKVRDESILAGLRSEDAQIREYYCYVLLDFVTVDPGLEELALMGALSASLDMGLEVEFEKLVVKELKMRIRDVRGLRERSAAMLAKAEVSGE